MIFIKIKEYSRPHSYDFIKMYSDLPFIIVWMSQQIQKTFMFKKTRGIASLMMHVTCDLDTSIEYMINMSIE